MEGKRPTRGDKGGKKKNAPMTLQKPARDPSQLFKRGKERRGVKKQESFIKTLSKKKKKR